MSDARQRILDTAGRLFRERGYELVGINEIIEKADVAKATFYQHFGSKEKLCTVWLSNMAAESTRASAELLRSDLPPEKKLEKTYERLKGYLTECNFRACPFSNTASMVPDDNELRQVVREYKQNSRLFWQALALEFTHDQDEARMIGDGLFVMFSGAITEAQNALAMWPVDSALAAARVLCLQSVPV